MSASSILALSIRQPWAALILAGHKKVENRSWTTSWRGTLAVHAGQKLDRDHMWLTEVYRVDDLTTGAYLGLVDLVDIHHATDCGGCTEWSADDQFHWQLDNPFPFQQPIAGPGRLGLYVPPDTVLAAARGDWQVAR